MYPRALVQPHTFQPWQHPSVEASIQGLLAATLLQAVECVGQPPSQPPRLLVYEKLTGLFLFPSAHTRFWWEKVGRPLASMLMTANYPVDAQCRLLSFFFHSVIGLLEPPHVSSPSMMTIDGSPVELSWVIPQPGSTSEGAGGDSRSLSPLNGHKRRQVRFAIEPRHPVTGQLLRGSAVLDYLTSPRGSMGVVESKPGDMEWRLKTEAFLYPEGEEHDQRYISDGSRFFVGFDFMLNGSVSLKAYYLPSLSPRSELSLGDPHHATNRRLRLWDTDYEPLRRLVLDLDPGLMEPLDVLLSYFGSLDEDYRPRIQILSVDCVKSNENRLKIYCRPKRGSSFSDAVKMLTLGGELTSPTVSKSMESLQRLWDSLFPQATSSSDHDLRPHRQAASGVSPSTDTDVNGIKLNEADHPVEGLLYYFSLFPGERNVYPKVYLPVSRYCESDLAIARSLESFHSKATNQNDPTLHRFVEKEVSSVMPHRPLSDGTGIHTYITFGLKKRGWELTNYYSPEAYRA